MFDAAYPPASAFPGCQAVAGYIGGNTPHVWQLSEWDSFADLVQFPIWTGYLEADPGLHAEQCAAAMHALGWKPGAPNRRGVILDEETQVDGPWVDTFAAGIWAAGYQTFVYGSLATVMQNPPKEGYLVADWNGIPAIPPYVNVLGCQYEANVAWQGTTVDLSVISYQMLVHGGVGARG
jgi:hypothetical protein